MKGLTGVWALSCTLLLGGCGAGMESAPGPSSLAARPAATPVPCLTPGDPTAEAYEPARGPGSGELILPSGRGLTPSGTQVVIGRMPANMVVSADNRYVYLNLSNNQIPSIQQVDLTTQKVVATLQLPKLFFGLALSKDGKYLYAGGGKSDAVFRVVVGAPGLTLQDTWTVGGYPTGITVSPDGNRLLVAANMGQDLMELDPATGAVRRSVTVGRQPYQIAVSPDSNTAYVSIWGEASVVVVDLTNNRVKETIDTGKNPSAVLLSPAGDKLYVAASDSDRVEIYSTSDYSLLKSTPVGSYTEGLHGVSPNAMAFSKDGSLLYVANAADNAVEVYGAADLSFKGAIPTGWYPSTLALSPDGTRLLVGNWKGEGAGPNPYNREPDELMAGTLSIIPVPLTATQLTAGDAQVVANNTRTTALHEINCSGKLFPVGGEGVYTPIEHVVFLLRENKTYDAYLGDLEVGNGDPDLVLYGEQITPNTHALARQFTVLDNFYTDSEESDQGHMWTTTAFVNDYKERTCMASHPTDTGVFAASDTITGYIFDHLWKNGIDYVNYGEVVGLEVKTFKSIDLRFPGVVYNTNVKDQKKAEYVASRIQSGYMPSFTYLLLPNDHTNGTKEGSLSPQSMVSDNDYAVGLVVDAITKSPFWASTVIFILQDDPQDGADHVDAHRSPALVVSPWSRHGYVSSVHYSIPSILRTIGLMLDFPPLTQYDAYATPMYDAFTATPDYSTYTAIPRQVPDTYNERNTVGAAESARMDFSGPDRAPGLGKVLWRYLKGTEPPAMLGAGGDGDEDEDEDELSGAEMRALVEQYRALEGQP